jgi:hypothetical protein
MLARPRTGARSSGGAPLRVNARLDPAYAAKLRAVVRHRGGSVTDALKFAIDVGYREAAAVSKARPVLDNLVGAFEGPEDLSANAKRHLAKGLARKHGFGR